VQPSRDNRDVRSVDGFDIMEVKPNHAHSVDAPIALLFHIVHSRRCATDAQHSTS